jgi:hypothetical protein
MRHVSVPPMCPAEETVAAYAAGQLTGPERDSFDSHLDTCRDCQELVAAVAKAEPRSGDATEPAGDSTEVRGGQLGRYLLLARLGAGGMGVVYAAYDPELDRRVALKVLRHARAGTRLRDEARAIAKLAHPNVVAVHDVGEVDEEVFVAMEHVSGVTLRDWLATPRTPREILDVFVQAGRGLAAAHRAGLVHRDVKPSNILVDEDGRARVADFGLAREADTGAQGVAGTPGYMAPEQQAGEAVDARADQYAFCVALAQALALDAGASGFGLRASGGRGGGGVSERVKRAVRRGMAERVEDRFPTMDELLAELAPRQRGKAWLAGAIAGGAVLGALAFAFARRDAAPTCNAAVDAIEGAWGDPQRVALRRAFAATKLPYAAEAGEQAIAQLDAWSGRWRAGAVATCKATVIDRVQPAELHALRRGCLDHMLDSLRPVVQLATHADAAVVAHGDALVASLPAPEQCDDTAALAALPPLPPGEGQRAEATALGAALSAAEAAIAAGHLGDADVGSLQKRAAALGYLPLRARAGYVQGRAASAHQRFADAVAALHAAARDATAARDLEQLAEIWIELVQNLGNDPRTSSEADVFAGYAEALIAQLPDRDRLGFQLAFARCVRNVGPAEAARAAASCRAVIDRAPPSRPNLAVAARTWLGHFQLLAGDREAALATSQLAVSDAERVFGAVHPDTAVARHALANVLLALERNADALVEERRALEIRRAVYPQGSLATVESLVGVGDALSVAGKDAEARGYFDEALAMLDRIHEGDSAQAMTAHIFAAMTLEALGEDDDALTHYVRGADIADRSLEHQERQAALALRSAAALDARHGRAAAGIGLAERALRLLERGKAPAEDIALTEQRIAELKKLVR